MLLFSLHVQTSILCKSPSTLSLSSNEDALVPEFGEQNMVAVVIHNPLPVQRNSYISVQLPNGLCAQVT